MALTCIGFGLHFVYGFHDAQKIEELYNLHSWLGLGAIVCFTGLYQSSFIIIHFPGVTELMKSKLIVHHKKIGTFAAFNSCSCSGRVWGIGDANF